MVPAVRGAAIEGVVANTPAEHSPAALAGIQPGDFVTAINNSPVTDLSVLRNGSFYVGEAINVTVWQGGQTRVVPLVLSNYTETVDYSNGTSRQVTYPFIGVDEASYADLQTYAGNYANAYKSSPIAYLVSIPTFGGAQYVVPFSDVLSPFYTSPLGGATALVAQALFWLFFVNFNLAIFNSLPIYPMDGGQAFETALRGAGRGRISDELARRVTTGVTLAVFFALFIVIAGPYITGVFQPA
jgi:membrane-associated protease RseP (regulator of RpoE activity)